MCRQILENTNKRSVSSDLLTKASRELEDMKQWEKRQTCKRGVYNGHRPFPPACLCLLKTIPGNIFCVDCGAANPQWATITYGALLCLNCSGKHRRLGVQLSKVRSITMDSWSHQDVLAMLEGGNKQLSDFFSRHGLSCSQEFSSCDHGQYFQDEVVNRYQTNAAMFYRNNLSLHIHHVEESGEYKGRDWSRRRMKKKNSRRKVQVVEKEQDCKANTSHSTKGRSLMSQ